MKTVLTTSPTKAAAFIKGGGIVAFPTETVYGLGADIFNIEAIEKIFTAKRRPNDNPLIAHVSSPVQISTLVTEINDTARLLITKFFPGPLTLVLPKAEKVPLIATANLDTIGVRMPRNDLARMFLTACETPLVAPSANLSGKPSPTSWEAVFEDLDGRIDCILQGETTEIGIESTVVDCTGSIPIVLRHGGISIEELQKAVPTVVSESPGAAAPRSPGLKHRHYSPAARVVIVSVSDVPGSDAGSSAYIGIKDPGGVYEAVKICDTVETYVREVFAFFRECDRLGIQTIFCESVDETGLGIALMDRLKRAAEK